MKVKFLYCIFEGSSRVPICCRFFSLVTFITSIIPPRIVYSSSLIPTPIIFLPVFPIRSHFCPAINHGMLRHHQCKSLMMVFNLNPIFEKALNSLVRQDERGLKTIGWFGLGVITIARVESYSLVICRASTLYRDQSLPLKGAEYVCRRCFV